MSVFDNAAARLKEHLPTRKSDGKEITAWAEQARALNTMRKELANALDRIEILENSGQPIPEPPPPPDPDPPTARYAPRAYNTAPNGSDARFCMDPQWGVTRVGDHYVDQMGVHYDEGGRDLGGRSKKIVPELKPANEMDDRVPCDPYVGPTGARIGGSAGYPPGSFEQ